MKSHGHAIILNRDFQLPADGWYQVAPYGEISAPMEVHGQDDPVDVVQVFHREDAEAIVAKFREQAKDPNFPGLLIDYDHFSHDTDKPSTAAGWIVELEARDTGLWAKHRWSDEGEAALRGGRYRLFSPVFGFEPRTYSRGQRVHPAVLLRGALTNDPRFKGMVPLSHRQGDPLASTQQSGVNMDYKAKLLALLGLPATASDADIEAALGTASATMNKGQEFDATKNRLDTLLAAQIERDLDDHGIKGEAREKWKSALTKNREDGLALLATLGKDGSGYARTHNRGTATVPGAGKDKGTTATLDQQRDAAVQQYRTANRCSFDEAWNATRIARPELFAEPAAQS